MYTFEERMKVVKLNIQSGCIEGTVIRTLVWPALRNKNKEYHSMGNLCTDGAPKPPCAQAQKRAAEYCAVNHTTLAQTCGPWAAQPGTC